MKSSKTVRSHSFAAFLLTVSVLIVWGMFNRNVIHTATHTTLGESGQETVDSNLSDGLTMSASAPTTLHIPSLDLKASFEEPLYLEPDGEIEVPAGYETLGYYGYGPTPGELGPAVVLGHVDSVAGPAIFYELGQLEVGDELYIDREDGTRAIFAVTAKDRPSQQAFPTAAVYGDTDHAGLRLITCSGNYDRGQQRYTHNLIVYAELVSTSTSATVLD